MRQKSLIALFSLMIVVIAGLLVTIIVLASQTQNLNSNISISYTATEISGGVSATYKIGDGEEKDMVVNGNTSQTLASFSADLNTTTQGLSPTESQLVLLFRQDLLFTYTFYNTGDYPYYATLNYTDTNNDDENILKLYKSATDSDFSDKNSTQITVPARSGASSGTTTFQVKMKIGDPSFDSNMSGVFNWNLSKSNSSGGDSDAQLISLSFTNNTNSKVNADNVKVVYSEDKSKFKLVGPTPIVVDGTTTNLANLKNSSDSEFYYFASNSEVKDTTGYTDPGTTYHLSPYSSVSDMSIFPKLTADTSSTASNYTAKEVWYNTPEDPTIIYATFMTPTNSDGVLTAGATYTDVIFSHSVNIIPAVYYSSSSDYINMDNCVVSNSIVLIKCSDTDTLETTSYVNKDDVFGATFEPGGGDFKKKYASIFNRYDYSVGVTLDSKFKKILLSNSLEKIGDNMFAGQPKLSTIIPESVTSIGSSAFYYCDSLKSITIPDSVISIGSGAFYGCRGLTSVTFKNTSGWQVSTSSDFSSYTELASDNLSNTSTAATYLRQDSSDSPSGYCNYYWKRS